MPQKNRDTTLKFRCIPLSVYYNISKWHQSREFVVVQDIEGAAIHPLDYVWLVNYFS
jgi:hypothetical protein